MRRSTTLALFLATLTACDPPSGDAEPDEESIDEDHANADDEETPARPAVPGLELEGELEMPTPPAGCTWQTDVMQYATTGVKTATAYCVGGPVLVTGNCTVNHEDHAWLTSSGTLAGIPGNGWQCRAYHSDADWFFSVTAHALCCDE